MKAKDFCEIFDKDTKARCSEKAKTYLFVEADAELTLCPKHLEVWKKRGTMKEVVNENQETNYDHAFQDNMNDKEVEHGR
jgi:Zn-finger nucleic acid-binding protein